MTWIADMNINIDSEMMAIIAVILTFSSLFIAIILVWRKNIHLHRELNEKIASIAIFETHKIFWQEKDSEYRTNISKLSLKLTEAEQINILLDKKLSNTELMLEEVKGKTKDWQNAKEEMIKAANSAVYQTGMALSSNLIKQHNEQTKLQSEENIKAYHSHNQELHQQFNKITQSVTILMQQVKDSTTMVDLVKQALLEPGKAGYLSELALENLLKNSGLDRKRDYLLQANFNLENDSRIRPDAVVFLPQDNLMIIDSKSSSFFLEIAQKCTDDERKIALQKLKLSMHTQLKSLSSKDYKEGVINSINSGKEHKVKFATVIMFLPSDGAFDILQQADINFVPRAWDLGIIPVGPAGLLNILLHAKFLLNQDHQVKNYESILGEISKLLGSVGVMADHAQKLGQSIKSTMQNYDRFAASFNKNFMHKANKLTRFGIKLPASKEIESNAISRYHIIALEEEKLPELEESNS